MIFATLAAAAWVALVRPGPLSLAYFWDEADVYVPGARWVAEHGLTVTPGVFPDDYSRGHPPLLYLLAGIVFRLFGSAPTVGHLTVLPFTVIAIAGTYLLGARLYDRRVGLAAALLLATTPLFMSIGNMLLPEMPLVALTVLALLALAHGRLGLAILAGVAMVWIKETGIFSAAAIGVGVLFDAWRAGTLRERGAQKRLLLATVPLLALIAFFVWQRFTAGYFVFPHHQNLFTDRPLDASNVLTVWPSLLVWHGRWIVLVSAILAVATGVRAETGASSGAAPSGGWVPSRAAVLAACVALVVFNALFFTKMFWLERYALPAHPGLLVLMCGVLFTGFRRLAPLWRETLAGFAVTLGAVLGVVGLFAPTAADNEEHTFVYADVIATHRAAFAALSDEDAPVFTSWPMTVELEDPALGYAPRPLRAFDVAYVEGEPEGVGAVLVNDASGRAEQLRDFARAHDMRLVRRYRHGRVPVLELWRPDGAQRGGAEPAR